MPLIPLHQTVGSLFPGMIPPAPQTYAAWPVWRDSTTKEVKFQPMPKRQAVKLWHDARRFERQTRQPGYQDGAIGRNGLAMLQALLFDFLNYASGAPISVVGGDCRQSLHQRAQRRPRPGEAQGRRRAQLAAPLRRGLGRRALHAAPGDQRLCGAAVLAVARLLCAAPCPAAWSRHLGRSPADAERDRSGRGRCARWWRPCRSHCGAGE